MNSEKAAPDRLDILLYGVRIGRMSRRGTAIWIEYLESYASAPDRPVFSLRYEDSPRANLSSRLRLPPWYAGLLPEGRVRAMLAADAGVLESDDFAILAHTGHDLPGAVSLLPVGACEAPGPQAHAEPPSDGSLDVGDLTEGHGILRFSLAGAALKFSMVQDSDRLTLPARWDRGDWIVKLPDPEYPDLPRHEHAMAIFAGQAGIDVPETQLISRDMIDLPPGAWRSREAVAFASRRFDRDDHRHPVHIEDLAQVRGFAPDEKYRGTFETLGNLVYRGVDEESFEQFIRRLVFFVLIGNDDAHLKNWSLIYRDRFRPTLAPAYDIVATENYLPPARKEGLTLGGKSHLPDFRIGPIVTLGERLGVRLDVGDIAADAVRRTVEAFSIAADALGGLSGQARCLEDRL
ncbi:MAG: type II toxin-antitoxin system HipA family toxin, partial [Bifidobacteriaceae bacterium]|nr:type II toxin-antitoxin system HipA family toxin [Bifidobacteriaceae bacterium]